MSDIDLGVYLNRDIRNQGAVNRLENAAKTTSSRQPRVNKKSKLYEVCQDFEAIFIKQMLNVMRKTIHKTGVMDGGLAEEVFEDMLYDKYASKMAKSGQFGISDMLYDELSRGPTSLKQ
jgi:flagellar protein FlgJ